MDECDRCCDTCEFFVQDTTKKEFGRCFFNPPVPIVRTQRDRSGQPKEAVKTTRPIVYPNDYCGHWEEAETDRRNTDSRRGTVGH